MKPREIKKLQIMFRASEGKQELFQMAEYAKDEALAFINAIRLGIDRKVGFKHLVEKLSNLAAYIESIAAENERLNAYLDQANARDDYESHRSEKT